MTRVCPKCGAEMVRRAGGRLWGCVRYPRCLGAQQAEDSHVEAAPLPHVIIYRTSSEVSDLSPESWEQVHLLASWDNGPVTGIATVTGHECLFNRILEDDSRDAANYNVWSVDEETLEGLMVAMSAPSLLLNKRTHLPTALVGGTGYPCLLIDPSAFDQLWVPLCRRSREMAPLGQWSAEFRPKRSSGVASAVAAEHWIPLEARWSAPQ